MRGFAVYTTEHDPSRLYSTGDADELGRDEVVRMTRSGDTPLDLMVDVGQQRILWTFRGDRRTKATRTGNFIADCKTDDGDLFRAFEESLHTLHATDAWTLPRYDGLRWNAGFELPEIPPALPGLSDAEQERLLAELSTGTGRAEPIAFGVRSYESALGVIKALSERRIDCTVGVGSEYAKGASTGVDLFVRPNGTHDFEPLSESAEDVVDTPTPSSVGDQDRSRQSTNGGIDVDHGSQRSTTTGSPENRIAGAVLLVLLGFSSYSFLSTALFHPITGLAAFGGFVGATAGFPLVVRRVTEGTVPGSRYGFLDATRDAIRGEIDHSIAVIAALTVVAYLYPTVLRVSGAVVLGRSWVFGPVGGVVSTLLSLVLYLGVVVPVSVGVLSLYFRRHPTRTLDRYQMRTLGYAFAIYGGSLFLATGLADAVWYSLIPAA